VDHFNYDALNAVAAGYFELCYRTGQLGSRDFADDARADRLLIVPWEAYGRIDDPGLRDAILDFFEDAGAGMKLGTAATAPRLAGIVASLETKETDPGRRARIQRLAGALSLERSPE
jgi:hypothetical protein